MVVFVPFPGFRPALKDDESIEDRISPPYDVIGPDYLAELQSKPCNVTRFTLMPENGRYQRSREELDAAIAEGSLVQDPESFYLYRQTFDDKGTVRVRTGLAGLLRTERFEDGNIIPHEETFSKVKADRLNLLRDMETHLESIFGIYDGFTDRLNAAISASAVPLYDYTDSDGVRHEYFRVSDPEVLASVTEEMRGKKMLIADGHHRYETALNYSLENPGNEKKAYVLATMVASDDDGLVIWPTHRLIKAEDIGENSAIKKISKTVRVEEAESPEDMMSKLKDHKMGLYFKSGKCLLADMDSEGDPMWDLDTYIAQEKIIYGVYKADEGKSAVSYDAEADSVMEKMKNKEFDLAILLNDPSLRTIWDLSMIGKRMPKKTTFFFPKIWSGFAFYRMV
ncbi:MAG: DUF1015 family protein [Candidatus Methanomethylophilaceae archaeon]